MGYKLLINDRPSIGKEKVGDHGHGNRLCFAAKPLAGWLCFPDHSL